MPETFLIFLEQFPYCIKNLFRVEILHAVVRTHRCKITRAIEIWFKNYASIIQIELVVVENIVKQNKFFFQCYGNMHCHRNGGHYQIALIHQVNKDR